MLEILVVFLFFVGIGVAFWLAMEAVQRRTIVWYAVSGLLPCLYSLVGFFILGLINGRGVDIPVAAFFGILLSALGWMIAWHDGGEQRRIKQAELAEVEERVINDQSYIDATIRHADGARRQQRERGKRIPRGPSAIKGRLSCPPGPHPEGARRGRRSIVVGSVFRKPTDRL